MPQGHGKVREKRTRYAGQYIDCGYSRKSVSLRKCPAQPMCNLQNREPFAQIPGAAPDRLPAPRPFHHHCRQWASVAGNLVLAKAPACSMGGHGR